LNKTVLATTMAAVMLFCTTVTFAETSNAVTFDGNVFYNYRSNTNENPNNKDNKTGLIINFHAPASEG